MVDDEEPTRCSGPPIWKPDRGVLRPQRGDQVAILESDRDITQRRQTEEVLRQTDEKLRALVLGVQDYAILMLDTDGLVTTWNDGAERIKGYRAEEKYRPSTTQLQAL